MFIDRIEVIKGPNGILHANSSPGGVINIVSKRPTEQPFGKFLFMGGSFGFYQAELDTSQFLDTNHEWGIRIAGTVSDDQAFIGGGGAQDATSGFQIEPPWGD